jgi:hypothetical protein
MGYDGEQGASRWIADRKGSVRCAGPRELSSKRVDGPLGGSAGSGAEYRTVPCPGGCCCCAPEWPDVGDVVGWKRN